ncbi:MAG: TolC family protein [Holosporaceae bacterium]|jgi:outer membrane protein|nr:TolC family protein [Holosporaceae bacterium]
MVRNLFLVLVCFYLGADYEVASAKNPAKINSNKIVDRSENNAAQMEGITFEESVVAAYNNNPAWFGSQTENKVAEEYYKQSKLMFLPSVEASVSTSRKKQKYDEISDDEKATSTEVGISLTQNLFNGFSTVNTMRASNNSSKAALYKLKFDEQDLIIKVLEAYMSVWAGRQKVVALKKKEENLKNTLNSQKSSLEFGVGTPSEVAFAGANYQKAVYERINAETELSAAKAEFERLTGLTADRELGLPRLSIELPKNLNDLIVVALGCNNSILHYRFAEQAAFDELNVARGRLSPSCDLRLEADRNLPKGGSSKTHGRNTYSASLQVRIPIFSNSPSSGNSYSAIAIANQKALKAEFSAQNAVLEIKKECIVNWNVYISANAMIQSSRSAVKSAELSSAGNLEESSLGLKSNTEVWDKENRLLESRIDLVNSKKQKIIAGFKLFALTGKLNLYSVLKKK